MTTQRIVLGVLLAFALSNAGCASTQPEKFADEVRGWVPIGTSENDAEKIMTRKGFECRRLSRENPFNAYDVDCLRCDRDHFFQHDWTVTLFLKDKKVTGYGPSIVDEVSAKSRD